jgi:hypothetical protein
MTNEQAVFEVLAYRRNVGATFDSQLDRLRRLLDCPCCGVALEAVRWRYALDAKTYAEAVGSYRSRF